MSVVYLANDIELGRQLAIKVLKPDVAGALAVGRFLREIAVQSRLQHANILSVLDSGECDGLPYILLPYVEGGSLRQRLSKEKQLPWEDALRVSRDIASALDAAHAAGVVHRDVKPENVLLNGDQSLLADFGIARAFTEAATERLTESGIVIGTAGYMSPEQCEGIRELDARSDIYALACVTYEMLAGETPYTGPSRVAIAARQLTLPVPSLRLIRSGLPQGVDEVFKKALAKSPADRYQRANEFTEALERAAEHHQRRVRNRRYRMAAAGAIAIAGVGLAMANRTGTSNLVARAMRTAGDTTTIAIFPLVQPAGIPDESRRVRDAFLGWSGIRIVDDAAVREAMDGNPNTALTGARYATTARRLRAGRFIRGEAVAESAGTTLHLRLYDAGGAGALIEEVRGTVRSGATDGATIHLLVDSLLLRDGVDDEQNRPGVPRSLPARQYFLRGQRAMASWNLGIAEASFDSAASLDSGYVRPRLALALVRAWTGAEPAKWRIAAEQALVGANRLPRRDRLMAEAIVAQARGDLGRACPLWEQVISADTLHALSWFGSAQCKAADSMVLPDRRSPSGYRFRTSYHRALLEYQRSFELLPPILTSFRDRSFEPLRRLFLTSGWNLRSGRAAPPATERFTANAWWIGDSLAFVPSPLQSDLMHVSRNRESRNEALRRLRELVRSIASSWVASYPTSTDAWQALSVALAQIGDRSALDTIARARKEARDPASRLRAMMTEVSLELAFAVSDGDAARLPKVVILADSLLGDTAAIAANPLALSSIAALLGRANLAAELANRAPADLSIPIALHDGGPSLLVFSSLGGPRDSLESVERRVTEIIDRNFGVQERAQRRQEFLGRAASMAFPAYESPLLQVMSNEGDPLCALEVALLAGDRTAVRRGLDYIRADRRDILAESLTLDALVPESELMWKLGDVRGTLDWIAPTLAALPHEAHRVLSSPIRGAMVVRALMITARARARNGQLDASRRDALAASILWSKADAFLQPIVAEARALASQSVSPR